MKPRNRDLIWGNYTITYARFNIIYKTLTIESLEPRGSFKTQKEKPSRNVS